MAQRGSDARWLIADDPRREAAPLEGVPEAEAPPAQARVNAPQTAAAHEAARARGLEREAYVFPVAEAPRQAAAVELAQLA